MTSGELTPLKPSKNVFSLPFDVSRSLLGYTLGPLQYASTPHVILIMRVTALNRASVAASPIHTLRESHPVREI